MYRVWTSDDDERIKAFVAQDVSIVRAAAALKRKSILVRIRARKLGCPFPTINAARKKRADSADSSWRLYWLDSCRTLSYFIAGETASASGTMRAGPNDGKG
jgi:hypothetical protein